MAAPVPPRPWPSGTAPVNGRTRRKRCWNVPARPVAGRQGDREHRRYSRIHDGAPTHAGEMLQFTERLFRLMNCSFKSLRCRLRPWAGSFINRRPVPESPHLRASKSRSFLRHRLPAVGLLLAGGRLDDRVFAGRRPQAPGADEPVVVMAGAAPGSGVCGPERLLRGHAADAGHVVVRFRYCNRYRSPIDADSTLDDRVPRPPLGV